MLLLTLGLAVAFVPERVPGLTLPDSPEAMRAMEAMGMEEGGTHEGMREKGMSDGKTEEHGGMGSEEMGGHQGMGSEEMSGHKSMGSEEMGGKEQPPRSHEGQRAVVR